MSVEDLNWVNFHVPKMHHRIIRWSLKGVSSFILLFASSPASLYYFLIRVVGPKDNKPTLISDSDNPYTISYFFSTFVPPLIIILLNRIIISLLLTVCRLKSKLGEQKSLFEVPKTDSQQSLYLHHFQHVNCTRTRYPNRSFDVQFHHKQRESPVTVIAKLLPCFFWRFLCDFAYSTDSVRFLVVNVAIRTTFQLVLFTNIVSGKQTRFESRKSVFEARR